MVRGDNLIPVSLSPTKFSSGGHQHHRCSPGSPLSAQALSPQVASTGLNSTTSLGLSIEPPRQLGPVLPRAAPRPSKFFLGEVPTTSLEKGNAGFILGTGLGGIKICRGQLGSFFTGVWWQGCVWLRQEMEGNVLEVEALGPRDWTERG